MCVWGGGGVKNGGGVKKKKGLTLTYFDDMFRPDMVTGDWLFYVKEPNRVRQQVS